jgi:peptide/nickel transport system substrate-binding protein
MIITRLFDAGCVQPPELIDFDHGRDWRNACGTGPYILVDFVPDNAAKLVRNPNYWGTDPVGPGKGNQLPYLDGVKILYIPDLSTRLAGLRTGKIDQMGGITIEDADTLRSQCPDILDEPRGSNYAGVAVMRQELEPFNDVRVRQAMTISIDYDEINQALYKGLGHVPSYPFWYTKANAALYVGLDDPDCPESVRELFSYNPERARELLKEAGYPNGFKTQIILTAAQAEYYSIIKEYWADVGIELEFDIKEGGQMFNILMSREFPALGVTGCSPPALYLQLSSIYYGGKGVGTNYGSINDPIINEVYNKINIAALTDEYEAMKILRDITPHILTQCYAINCPRYPVYTFWWPWLRNYSGEVDVGYSGGLSWARWVWIDEDLKVSTGH